MRGKFHANMPLSLDPILNTLNDALSANNISLHFFLLQAFDIVHLVGDALYKFFYGPTCQIFGNTASQNVDIYGIVLYIAACTTCRLILRNENRHVKNRELYGAQHVSVSSLV